jgi:multisubunit Na+/H+ antiporter MnhB subunit
MWVLVFAFNRRPASLTSALFESLLLGSAVGLNFIALAVLAKRFNPHKMRLALMALMCGLAVLLCAFFPVLGE